MNNPPGIFRRGNEALKALAYLMGFGHQLRAQASSSKLWKRSCHRGHHANLPLDQNIRQPRLVFGSDLSSEYE